jgi:outer membrane lipoprotein-sorting protein
MNTLKAAITVGAVFLFTSTTLAQPDEETRQKLAEIERKAKVIESYKVVTKVETEVLGKPLTTKEEISFKRPGKVRMTTKAKEMIIETYSTGDILWTYRPTQRIATRVNLRKVKSAKKDHEIVARQADITKPFDGLPKDVIKYIESKETDEGEVYIFEARPDSAGQTPGGAARRQMLPEKVIVWISSETGLPTKTIKIGKSGATMMEKTYSDFQINPVIDDSEFEFTPPADAQVYDLTQAAVTTRGKRLK